MNFQGNFCHFSKQCFLPLESNFSIIAHGRKELIILTLTVKSSVLNSMWFRTGFAVYIKPFSFHIFSKKEVLHRKKKLKEDWQKLSIPDLDFIRFS